MTQHVQAYAFSAAFKVTMDCTACGLDGNSTQVHSTLCYNMTSHQRQLTHDSEEWPRFVMIIALGTYFALFGSQGIPMSM